MDRCFRWPHLVKPSSSFNTVSLHPLPPRSRRILRILRAPVLFAHARLPLSWCYLSAPAPARSRFSFCSLASALFIPQPCN
ncbi:hypothetical protein B0H11DRAFT_2299581 [Mycena galericulata]|nr:hypothetical protein B0H11DRAFT_2299581 [Mycena galericulata]